MTSFAFDTWFISVYGKNRDPQFKSDMEVAFNAGVMFMQHELDVAEEHIAYMTKELDKCFAKKK